MCKKNSHFYIVCLKYYRKYLKEVWLQNIQQMQSYKPSILRKTIKTLFYYSKTQNQSLISMAGGNHDVMMQKAAEEA